MGHTVWSQRIATDVIIAELKAYGKSLREEDREIYERLLKLPLKRVGSISYASSIHVWAFLLLSAMLEQEKRIMRMEAEIERLAHGRISEGELDHSMVEDA